MSELINNIKEAFSRFVESADTESPISASEAILQNDALAEGIREEFERAVISDIKQKYNKRKQQKQGMELTWRLCMSFYNGDQFTYIDPSAGDLREMPLQTTWEERNTFNEIAPIMETRAAALSKRKNKMRNRPASSSAEDRTSAKIGNKVLASVRSRLRFSEKQQEAIFTAGVMGSCIWKTTWDYTKGRVVGYRQIELDDEEARDLTLAEYEKKIMGESMNTAYQVIREGDVNTTIHSPFEIFPENCAKTIRDNRRIMHVVLLSPEEVWEKWGVVEEGTKNTTYKIVESDKKNYGGAISGRMFGSLLGLVEMDNTVRVYEEHELPSAKYPKGRLIICTDNHLLYYSSLPDSYGENGEYEFCFDVQQSLKTDGFFGKSLIERMIPLQIKYNSVKNRKQDYLNRVTMGVVVAEEGALTDEDALLEDGIAPGTILQYHQGFNRPSFMDTPALPSAFENEESDLLVAFNRLSGVSQLAQMSTTPTNVQSGVALSALAEQDDTRIGLEAENLKLCLMNIGRKWLILYRDHAKYPRMVKDIGRNEEFEISEFVGSDLTSFDVFIEAETESSDTLAQRRQKVIELLNSGLFNDTQTGNITNEGRAKIFEMLELGNWEDFVEADDAQQRKADRENNLMVIGKTAEIRPFDDDVIHISKHNNFRLMAEYEEALQEHPEIDEIFREHVDKHLHNLQIKSSSGSSDGVNTGAPDGQVEMATDGAMIGG